MALNNVNRFKTLLWKNCIIEWSDICGLVEMNIIPFILSLALIPLRIIIPVYSTTERIFNEAVSIDNLELFMKTPFAPNSTNTVELHLAYSPNTSIVFQEIVKAAATSLNLKYSGYTNARALASVLKRENYFAGVQFDDALAHATRYPNQLHYMLRFPNRLRKHDSDWYTDQHFPLPFEATVRNDIDGGSPIGYLREGFLPVQNAISTAFIMQVARDNGQLPKIVMQRYPLSATSTSLVMTYVHNFIGVLFVLSFDSMSLFMVKCVMEEKEKQLKEVLKIFGLQSWIQWLAWFVSSLMMMSVCIIYITTILVVEWKDDIVYITYASTSLIVFFFMAYSMSYVTMQFFGTTFLSKAAIAAFVMELLCYITLSPYFLMYLKYNQISLGLKLILCLLPNVAMCTGVSTIFIKERSGEGWHWSNMFMQASADDSLSLGLIIIMMLISCVLYAVLCLYVEQILPSAFGVPQKWNFPFKKNFWTGEHEYIDVDPIIKRENPDAFEAEPLKAKIGVQIINLSKKFGNHLAVDNVALNLYKHEVTVLLGHNGAGKTTMISMLIGMIPSTSGTAIINGYDIRENLTGARMSLSICPQQNILFDGLTVRQHLIFYGRLKGLEGNALETEVESYMKKTNLEKKANVESAKLSGGMKRKLSVCAALCGGTKVVLLDEPSSGLDPVARRHLWDLILSEKQGRTILLTTHFMDEAEVLGDRIAILSGGKLQCYGTPFFLKKKFGCGYILICVKKPNCDSAEVTKLLDKYIPGIQATTEIGSELSYRLPDSYTPQYKMMLQDLESNSDELNLEGYGISITSLEDVFMKVGAASQEHDDTISFKSVILDNEHRAKGKALFFSQWRAMILKKVLFRIRHVFLLAAQICLPIVFGILLWLLLKTSAIATGSLLKPLALNLLEFPETVTVLETKPNVKAGSLEDKISKNYMRIVESLGPDHVLETTGKRNFIDYMLDLGRSNQNLVNNKYIAAATVDEGKITAWLNNEPLHTAPITLNLIHNAIARSVIGPSASIYVMNHPLLPPLAKSVSREDITDINLNSVASSMILLCLCFISPLYVLFLIKERQSRVKLLEFVGGVRAITFWMSHFLNDMFTLTITMVVLLIAISFSQVEGYATFEELGRIGVILIFANSAILPLMYICADSSSSPATGYTFALSILLYSIYFCHIITEITKIGHISADWLLLVPSHDLQRTMAELKINAYMREVCRMKEEIETGVKCEITPFFAWEKPGILRHMFCFVVTSTFFFSILFLKESHFMSIIWDWKNQREAPVAPHNAYVDEDVQHEKDIVDNLLPSEIAKERLVLDRITKYYKKFLAVNEISLIVRESECFGLLGMNGAGKTSTFKMLIGDENISSGHAFVKGISLRRNMHDVYDEIGYCPQFDALLDDMTGCEMLKIFCLIHGIPGNHISEISKELAVGFGFAKYYNKQVHTYSGGNKRKLSVAIAVLGNPSIIYLDEPTSGMDPAARRQLWNILCKFRDFGKSMVLTSHSLDECEALCTRLAIMVNGEFKCLGSIQHLKNRFTKGLTLKIKVAQDPSVRRESIQIAPDQMTMVLDNMKEKIQRVIEFVKYEFPQSELKHEIEGLLSFNIPLTKITWSEIFGIMEDNKDDLNIEDYSINQTSLEDIFLHLAEKQLEDPRA